MKKLTIFIFLALIMIAIATAYTVGQTITQQQLDSQDIINIDLEDSFLKDDNNKVVHEKDGTNEIFYVNIETLEKETAINETDNSTYFTGNYIVVEKKSKILVDINRWKTRKDEVGLTQAKSELKQWLKAMKGRIESEEKNKIQEYQTKDDNLDDFILDDMEI